MSALPTDAPTGAATPAAVLAPVALPVRWLAHLVDWTVIAMGTVLIALVFANVVIHAFGKDLASMTELGELLMATRSRSARWPARARAAPRLSWTRRWKPSCRSTPRSAPNT